MAHALRPLIRQSGVGTALVALLFVFALASQAARAQSAAPEQTVRFTVFSARPAAGLTYVARARQAASPLVLYPTARSPRYEYRGAMPLRITDAATKSGDIARARHVLDEALAADPGNRQLMLMKQRLP